MSSSVAKNIGRSIKIKTNVIVNLHVCFDALKTIRFPYRQIQLSFHR